MTNGARSRPCLHGHDRASEETKGSIPPVLIPFIEKVSASPRETMAFGKYIAGFLEPGCVIALHGGLGSGKTCLAKGIARGWE